MKRFRGTPEEKFWHCTDKQGDDQCWNWTKGTNAGYGWIHVGKKQMMAHRFSYEMHIGPIPEGMLVLHSCFNRRCVNPAHLRIGTNKDNMNDYDRTGDRHAAARVPDCVQKDVIRRYKAGEASQKQLATELAEVGFSIHKSTISGWATGLRRGAATGIVPRKQHRKVPDCVKRDIVRRYKAGGVSQQQLADELVSHGWTTTRSTISLWIAGKTRNT